MTDASASELTIEPRGSRTFAPCPCCGDLTYRVWGYVHRPDAAEAAYFVEWIPGAVSKHGAIFDLILGQWGSHARPADRVAVALEFRQTETGPGFMVIDAMGRATASSPLIGRALSAEEVLRSELAQRAFAVVDAIWLQDGRISELVSPVA